MAEGEDGAIEHRQRGLGLSQHLLEGGVEVWDVVIQGRTTLPRRKGGGKLILSFIPSAYMLT